MSLETFILNPANLIIFVVIIVLLIIWESVWKLIAMWKCGRNDQLVWFILIAILNTAGILPIIYILFLQKKKEN